MPGDVILKVDGVQVALAGDLQRQILGKKIGQKVDLDVWRAGKVQRLAVMTGEQPDSMLRASFRPQRNRSTPSPQDRWTGVPGSPGLTVRDVSPEALREYGIRRQESGGVIVTAVEPMSPAAVAGIEAGDIITEAGGRPILGKKDFDKVLQSGDQGRGILLILLRGGQRTVAILKP